MKPLIGEPRLYSDKRDAKIAKARLREIETNPKRLISGKKLKARLDELAKKE